MRNLTVKREKSFVVSLNKLKIYIEDPASAELIINGTPCRKLGDLKNGEEKTFSIDENSAALYAIADKLTKDYCNGCYKIPAGETDIFVSGKNRYNPTNGNAFRFNGVTDEGILLSQKKNNRKGIIITAVAIIIGFIIGLLPSFLRNLDNNNPKTFSYEDFSITLTKAFEETSVEGFKICYDSPKTAVFVLEETFSSLEDFEIYSVKDYCYVFIDYNKLNAGDLQQYDGFVAFEYEAYNEQYDRNMSYLASVYETSDSFWLVQFGTYEEYFDELKSSYIEYSKTVEFANS